MLLVALWYKKQAKYQHWWAAQLILSGGLDKSFISTVQDLIRDELQSSFKQRAEQTVQRKQQELEEQLFKRTMDAVQEVDVDSQRVSHVFARLALFCTFCMYDCV